MPRHSSINGTLPTYRGVIHPKPLSLLCPKVQSSVEEPWQQQVSQPGHCSPSCTSHGSGGVGGGCAELRVSWGSVLRWLRALPLWSLGAKAGLGGEFPLLWVACRLFVKSCLFL